MYYIVCNRQCIRSEIDNKLCPAVISEDFTSTPFPLIIFSTGAQIGSPKCLTIPTVLDDISEGNESFVVIIETVDGPYPADIVVIDDTSLEVIIQDNTGRF